MVLVNSGFHTRQNSMKIIRSFGTGPYKVSPKPVVGQKKKSLDYIDFKGCQIISLPVASMCLGPATCLRYFSDIYGYSCMSWSVLLTGPSPLPKRLLNGVSSCDSSLKRQYLSFFLSSSSSCLHLLPRLSVPSIFALRKRVTEGNSYARCGQCS